MTPRPDEEVRRLVHLVRAFRGRRVVVVGDLVLDEFVHGDIERVSREAPVLILRHQATQRVPGGAANSVANLRALGAEPLPVGVVGRDEAGRALRATLRKRGISTAGIVDCAGYRTPTKSRVMAGGVHTRRQQIVRIDTLPAADRLPAAIASRLRNRLRKRIGDAEGLLVADYGYGAADPSVVASTARGAAARGVVVTVDSRSSVAEFAGVTACTPNQEELERTCRVPPSDEPALLRAGRNLLRRTGNRCLLLTRGARGMVLFRPRRSPVTIEAFGNDEVADVTGAGDTVIAAFSLALISGAEPLEAARLANYAAGVVVTKAGTATVRPAELLRAIRGDGR